jgi:hypothetical protein
MMTTDLRIGRVLRASTRGFVVGCRAMRENIPAFGALVSASPPVSDGVIYVYWLLNSSRRISCANISRIGYHVRSTIH